MSNVKAINGNAVPGYEPNPKIVEILEEHLEQAKRGEISAIAIATIDPEGCGNGTWHHKADYFSLIGSVAKLQHRLLE